MSAAPAADMLALADRFFAAIEAGDIDAVKAIYAPDATIWHNHDGKFETVERNLRTLAFMCGALSNRRYDISRRYALPGGFAQEHTLTGKLPDGDAFSLSAAIFVDVKAGRISALREYFDGPAANAPFLPFLPKRA